MTHDKYNELQKKLDKLFSDFVDVLADIETQEDLDNASQWADYHYNQILEWANTTDTKVLNELQQDYFKLKEMLLC